MAASLLLSSPAFNDSKAQESLHMHSFHQKKSLLCFFIGALSRTGHIKLYMKPSRIGLASALRTLGADKVSQGKVVLTVNKFQRSKTMFGSSSNTLDHGMDDFEQQLQELFTEVKVMLSKGNKNDARNLLQANYEAVKERIDKGVSGIQEAAILDIIALGYIAMGDFKLVRSILKRVDDIVSCLKDDEPLLDSVLQHMGSMYSILGKFEKSMLAFQRALGILERNYGKDSAFLITTLLGMAKALGSIGRATKAVETYNHAINILESSRDIESEDLVVPLFSLGNLLIKEGRASEAESPFKRILSIYEKLYGENDGRVGLAMCSLAHAKCAKGNVDEAIHLYRKALQTIRDSNYMTLDDNSMEKIRIDLAELLHLVGRAKEGRELLEECLLITEKYKGKEHPSSVTHLLNLATSYSQSKDFAEAERLLRTSIRIMMKTVGPEDQAITFPILNLAVTLYHLKRDDEAEQLTSEVLRIREETFGKESLPVGEALDCLASIRSRLGKDDNEIVDLLKRVLRIQEKEFGYESEEVMVTLKKVVFYLDKLGRRDEKFPLQKRLSTLRTKFQQMVHY